MSKIPPLRFTWEGDGFAPASAYFQRKADEHYVIGQQYYLIENEPRDMNSHSHFFACVNDAWKNLPDELLEQYQTPEMLRKKALIRTGFFDERSIVCASKAEAQRVAAFIKPFDGYAIVTAKACVVSVYTAKSQSLKAMGNDDFKDSKRKVLHFIDELLGLEHGATWKHAGKAA